MDSRWIVIIAAGAVGLECGGSQPRTEINPQDRIHSSSLDDMPAQGPSGLGTPMGYEDAGLRLVPMDGGARRER